MNTLSNKINNIKEEISAKTGFKITVKINSLTSSMRGYVTFSIKKQNGVYLNWSFDYSRELAEVYRNPEPHPTFCNNNQLSIYFGMEVYNILEEKKEKRELKSKKIKELTQIDGVKIPKYARNKNYFIGYSVNYGRKSGVKGSGGWGYAPNYVFGCYELNSENLKHHACQLNTITLCDGTKINKSEIKLQE
jgi:hypothetical protein